METDEQQVTEEITKLQQALREVHHKLTAKMIAAAETLRAAGILTTSQTEAVVAMFKDDNFDDLLSYERLKASRAEEKARMTVEIVETIEKYKQAKDNLNSYLSKLDISTADADAAAKADLLAIEVRGAEARLLSLAAEYRIKDSFYRQDTLRGFTN